MVDRRSGTISILGNYMVFGIPEHVSKREYTRTAKRLEGLARGLGMGSLVMPYPMVVTDLRVEPK